MTTFQDPPPQSRRAVRQSERGEAQSQTPVPPVPYDFDASQATPETPAASQATPDAPQPPVAPHHTGRRAQLPAQGPAQGPAQQQAQQQAQDAGSPIAGFEPLTYSTQGRVSPPTDEQSQSQPPRQSLATAPPPGSPDQPGFRVRDFSPEGGRRAAQSREPLTSPEPTTAPGPTTASPLAASASFPAPARAVDLDYQTQGVPPTPSHAATPAPVDDALHHTLSRRELREMRAAAEQQAPPLQMPPARLPEPIDSLLNSGPIDIPTLAPPPGQSQALAEAMAEFDLLTRSRREAEARARDAQVASLATPIIPDPQPSVPVPPVMQPSVPVPPVMQPPFTTQASAPQPPAMQPLFTPQASAPQPPAAAPLVFPLTGSLPSPPPPPTTQTPMLVEPVFLEPELALDQSAEPGQSGEPQDQDEHGGRSPRASNHWRVQAAMHDDELPYENTLSRTVGSNTSAITTSALVLPSVPQPDSMLGSLTSTGEILVTGSINLPRSLGSTGAHPDRVDNSDYEDDPFDSQVAAPDSAPVRAIRAISSNTSTRGVIETKKPQGNRLLTVVIIVAGVLCVALVGVVVYALASGKL